MTFPYSTLGDMKNAMARLPHTGQSPQARRSQILEVELAIEKLHEHQGANIEHQRKPQLQELQGFHVFMEPCSKKNSSKHLPHDRGLVIHWLN